MLKGRANEIIKTQKHGKNLTATPLESKAAMERNSCRVKQLKGNHLHTEQHTSEEKLSN